VTRLMNPKQELTRSYDY